jgi:hypothetical protein
MTSAHITARLLSQAKTTSYVSPISSSRSDVANKTFLGTFSHRPMFVVKPVVEWKEDEEEEDSDSSSDEEEEEESDDGEDSGYGSGSNRGK